MKRVISILDAAILITCCLTITKRTLTPVLMRNSNFGITPLELQGTDILFIGSSLFRQGLDTGDLNISGKRTYQLSYNGFQPFAEYLTLKRVLEQTDIELLVIDMYPKTITEEPGISDTRLFQDQSFTFIYDLFSQMHQYGDADYYDLFEMIVQSNNEIFFTWPLSYPLINKRYCRGSKIGESAGAAPEHLNSMEIDFGDDPEPNSIQTDALDNIIGLCSERDIEVVFLETPKYIKTYDDASYSDMMQSYLDFLKDKEVRVILSDYTASKCPAFSDVEVYKFASSDAGLFSDLIHISSDGRKVFTQTLLPLLN